MYNTIHYTKLKKCYKNIILKLQKDNDFNCEDNIQKKAINTLKFGLNIKHKGYNIFLSGLPGLGKTLFAKKYAQKIALREEAPSDFVYVYNFKNPSSPIAISFKAGMGKIFQEDIKNFINFIAIEVRKRFNSSIYLNERDEIVKKYQKLQEYCISKIDKVAREKGFELKSNKNSFYFLPIVEGDSFTEEEFSNLPYEKKEKYNKIIDEIQEQTLKYAQEIKEFDFEMKNKLEALDYTNFLFIVGYYITPLQEKYFENKKALNYIINLKEDMLLNLEAFIEQETEEDILQLMSLNESKNKENIFNKYNVNLFIDNSSVKGAPVILEYKPSYSNLMGEIELENDSVTNFNEHMKIKSGSLHKANNGYLIINIKDLLSHSYSFEALLKSLEVGKIKIEQNRENQTFTMAMNYISPEEIELNLKVILIGDEEYYNILGELDSTFLKLFKVHSIFDYELDNSEINIMNIMKVIDNICIDENLLKPDLNALNLIFQYLNKISETQNKLTARIDFLTNILIEANYFANIKNLDFISKDCISNVIKNNINSLNMYEEKLNEMILQNDIMIDTKGSKVGQINGLCVLDYGNYSFGKPSKITATTYVGKAGIVNIEKEAKISGKIHNKGVQVLTGYLGQNYAQEFPLSLSCRICFEQSYSNVDGDSATSTELYAILSSLSEVPIKQGIATTGSINQKGEIQPIGGVNQKIEGFFDICKKRGLTGNEGVIIPFQNVKDLCLKDEVILAVKDNKFNIYSIENINQGIEILTGVSIGKKDKNGNYEENSINFKVMQKLKSFYNNSKL